MLIVGLTQGFVWASVINPMGRWSELPVFLNGIHFFLLSLSTVFIAAAGYVINDYFDVRIDAINRPGKVIIERVISRRAAILWHSTFNVAGFLLAFYLGYRQGNYAVVVVQLLCTVLLWFYSTTFKRRFVIGNVIVALLTALTVLTLAVYEPALYPHINFDLFLHWKGRVLVNPFGVIMVYAYFAFMLTWMRELVKDMEDFKGDAEDGCVTMPIKIGLKRSVYFVFLLGILTIIPLFIAALKLCFGDWVLMGVYMLVCLVVPLVVWLGFLTRKAHSDHYALASRWLKIIMLSGICSLLLYYGLQYL